MPREKRIAARFGSRGFELMPSIKPGDSSKFSPGLLAHSARKLNESAASASPANRQARHLVTPAGPDVIPKRIGDIGQNAARSVVHLSTSSTI